MTTPIKYRISSTATKPMSDSVKGAPLTSLEIDGNFRSIKDSIETIQSGYLPAGYTAPVDYAAGIILSSASQTVSYQGEVYAPKAAEVPFTTSGVFEVAKFIQIQSVASVDLAAPSGSSLVGYDGGTVQDVLDGAKSLQDYAALRAYTGRAKRTYITGLLVAAKPVGITGYFQYDPTDNASLDNGGTIIVGADGRRWKRDFSGFVNVDWFEPSKNGTADDYQKIASAFSAGNKILFQDGSYLMSAGVAKLSNNVEVDFGNARFINGGAAFLFSFGATADTPAYKKLKIRGGSFEQSAPFTTNNLNYIRVAATKKFSIVGVQMENVSNGGIYIEAGCEDGVVDDITIDGISGYSTCRGIWINGATASDYADQLVDVSSITRNTVPLPVYAAKNIKVVNCKINIPFYGVYLMNTRDCRVENNYINISGGGGRCIAINNYSPRAKIKGNTLVSDQSATGILVTQFSHDVSIEENTFIGSFGGARDISVVYLSDAVITNNNRFFTDSTQNIQVNMGGLAIVRENYFTRPSGYSANARCVRLDTIDPTLAGTGTYGNTATTLPGLVFEDNIVKVRNCGVYVNTPTAQNGNIPGLDVVTVNGNKYFNADTAAASDEYGLRIVANGTTHVVKYSYFNNTMYPEANAGRNYASVVGSGKVEVRSDFQLATFRIVNAAGGGAVTSTKQFGGNFSCAASRSADAMVISPRTIGGSSGASVAIPISVVDAAGTAYKYDIRASGSNYVIRVFDSSGAQIGLATTAATFDVTVAHYAT